MLHVGTKSRGGWHDVCCTVACLNSFRPCTSGADLFLRCAYFTTSCDFHGKRTSTFNGAGAPAVPIAKAVSLKKQTCFMSVQYVPSQLWRPQGEAGGSHAIATLTVHARRWYENLSRVCITVIHICRTIHTYIRLLYHVLRSTSYYPGMVASGFKLQP